MARRKKQRVEGDDIIASTGQGLTCGAIGDALQSTRCLSNGAFDSGPSRRGCVSLSGCNTTGPRSRASASRLGKVAVYGRGLTRRCCWKCGAMYPANPRKSHSIFIPSVLFWISLLLCIGAGICLGCR